MKICDIAQVKVDWMKGYGNDPHLKFVLKQGRNLKERSEFRYRQYGNLFFAELDGEVEFLLHSRGDHHGFAGREFTLHMADDWDASKWKNCNPVETSWNHDGVVPGCRLDGRILTLVGPWSSGESVVSKMVRPVVAVSVLESRWRSSLRDPRRYQRELKRGVVYEGLNIAGSFTLEFCQEAISRLAPWLELYEGDYGWYPVLQGESPKNPRKGNRRPFDINSSDEQSMSFER